MSAPVIVALADVPAQAWRNGGGTTRELLALGGAQAPDGRISVADIDAPGPFSDFSGYERRMALLEGSGVALRGDAQLRLAPGGTPLVFRGEWKLHAGLPGGPARVLNVMSRRGVCEAGLRAEYGRCRLDERLAGADAWCLLAARGNWTVRLAGGDSVALDADTAMLHSGSPDAAGAGPAWAEPAGAAATLWIACLRRLAREDLHQRGQHA